MITSMTISQVLEGRLTLKITLDQQHPDYRQFFEKSRKHRWTIPVDVIKAAGIENLEEMFERYDPEDAGKVTVARRMGADKYQSKPLVTMPGRERDREEKLVESIEDIMAARQKRQMYTPVQFSSKGISYEVALRELHEFGKIPYSGIREPLLAEIASRQLVPLDKIEGNTGIVFSPAHLSFWGNEMGYMEIGVFCDYLPFLITDCEAEDKKTRQAYRKITAAGLIADALGGQVDKNTLMDAVMEHQGVSRHAYQRWMEYVSEERPFDALKRLQERYREHDLSKLAPKGKYQGQ